MRVAGVAFVASMLALAPFGIPAAFAGADTEPVIVVPGRPGVPIIEQGQDISGAIIEGEWGLARGHTGITIIKPRPFYPWPASPVSPVLVLPAAHYYPETGHRPRSGRLEVIPPANRPLPPPAQNFSRSWETHSDPLPPTLDAPYPPPMVGPMRYGGRHGPYQNQRQWQ